MAKDDYFVLAYRVLKYLYECFRRGKERRWRNFLLRSSISMAVIGSI